VDNVARLAGADRESLFQAAAAELGLMQRHDELSTNVNHRSFWEQARASMFLARAHGERQGELESNL
jgi:hypothetical protein